MREFDVTKFGAAGDGVADDTAAIQAALDAARANDGGGRVVFPPGVYNVTAMLELSSGEGGVGQVDLVGHGSGTDLAYSGYDGPQTIIRDAATNPVGTLLRLSGVRSMTVQDLVFTGKVSGDVTTGTLIEVLGAIAEEDPYNSELLTFRRIKLNRAFIGIKFGPDEPDETFVGNVFFERLGGQDCDTLCRVQGAESSNFRFNRIGAISCNTVVNVVSGGGINIDTANFTACGVNGGACIRFGEDGDSGGQNIAVSRLTNVRMEVGCKAFLVVRGDWQVAVDGMIEADDALDNGEDPPIELLNCSVAFNQCAFRTHDSGGSTPTLVAWSADTGKRCSLRFRDTLFDTSSFTVAEWIDNPTASRCIYSLQRCDVYGYVPFTDANTW